MLQQLPSRRNKRVCILNCPEVNIECVEVQEEVALVSWIGIEKLPIMLGASDWRSRSLLVAFETLHCHCT